RERTAQDEAQTQTAEVRSGRFERAIVIVEELVVQNDRPKNLSKPHCGARREVPRWNELRIRSFGSGELFFHHAHHLRERFADAIWNEDAVSCGLKRVEVLNGERRDERRILPDLFLQHARETVRLRKALRNEANERDAIDECKQRLARALEHL